MTARDLINLAAGLCALIVIAGGVAIYGCDGAPPKAESVALPWLAGAGQ